MSSVEPAFQVRLGVWQAAFAKALQRTQNKGEILTGVDCAAASPFPISTR